DFALTEAKLGKLRASIQATGILRPRADGEVYLSATSAGHLQGKGRFPFAGMKVERGQLLATITPRLGTGGDIATLKTAMDKARSEYQLATQSRTRLEKLWKEKAIAKHRLQEAKSTEAVAKAELMSAERRYKQSTGENQTEAGIPILAPISGLLAQVDAAPGKYVHEGDELFHIVNLDRLWLEARISESDIGRLHQPNGAWFTLEGFEGSFNTFDLGGRLAAAGGVIDPDSRTAPLTLNSIILVSAYVQACSPTYVSLPVKPIKVSWCLHPPFLMMVVKTSSIRCWVESPSSDAWYSWVSARVIRSSL
ncbi:MAG: efflux RND transporter periplasmic adaptor subunit, partial [Candidatus Thiodiazotropha endolucinida]